MASIESIKRWPSDCTKNANSRSRLFCNIQGYWGKHIRNYGGGSKCKI